MNNYKYVNIRMGSENHTRYSNGNCYPAVAVPHGMNFFSIQTNSQKSEFGTAHWFYSPTSTNFEGIRLTHMPSPWLGDYGKLLIWGVRGGGSSESYYSSYSPEKAVLEPSYMKLYAERDRYFAELTPTMYSASLRFRFLVRGKNSIAFSASDASFDFDAESSTLYIRTTQCNTNSYFASGQGVLAEHIIIRASAPVEYSLYGSTAFLTTSESCLELSVTTSYISREQAELNYKREVLGRSFEDIKAAAEDEWNEYLSRIEIVDSDEEKKAVFYSCMYRAFLWPRRFYETDEAGVPYHVNTKTSKITPGVSYVDNGFWDTFRTLYPYLSIIDTKLYAEMVEGFYNHYVDTGWLPKWLCPGNTNCMPGMLIEATVSDAIVKDIISGELAESCFEAILKDGECEGAYRGEGRVCLAEYRKYGYIPYTLAKESVNETLDNCFGDYAIAAAAKKLSKSDIAERYFGYSKNYEKLFDAENGFVRGKDESGSFRDEDFNPYSWGRDYTEGSAWQNSFGVYHDIEGLDKLYGGRLCDKIDELMAAEPIYDVGSYGKVIHEMAELAAANYGQCAISNQPSFHIPYIYGELGRTDKTAYHVQRLAELYKPTATGFPGDEDNGSASAWYLLSALGLYQMAPSRPDFTVSLPLFEKMTVKLPNGNTLYINKEDYDLASIRSRVGYFEVMAGGELAKICKK